MLLVQQSQGQI